MSQGLETNDTAGTAADSLVDAAPRDASALDAIADGATLYASTSAGLFSSNNGGVWAPFGGQCIRGVGKLALSKRDGAKKLYATAVDGIYSIKP